MAADERISALQKAYADTILNTAKEAATRIMMSERKAQRFQRELQVAKDEAVRMLLRLKQMMDSKITEAELTSLNQQRKIEELEAQLQEAEDIVKDLREELREAQSELDWVKNNKEQHLAEGNDVTQEALSEGNRYHSSESIVCHPQEKEFAYVAAGDMRNPNHMQRNGCHKFYTTMPNIGNSYTGCPDLPSIILRSKEPELYRNGCTQRIRALEGSLLDQELSLSGKINEMNNEIPAQENESTEEIYHEPTCGIENQRNFKKKVQGADGQLCNWQPIQSFGVKRKRGNRYRSRFNSSRNVPDLILRTDQAPDVSCMETHSSQSAQRIASGLVLSELGPPTSCVLIPDNEAKAEIVESHEDKIPVNDKMAAEKLVDARHKIGSVNSYTVFVGEGDHEKVNSLLPKTVLNDVACRTLTQPINERIIKYTFHRKRKKEFVNQSNGNTSLENKTSGRQALEKKNDTLEQEKANQITELSRDSRRLAQVARQLISLSEKKWWQ